MEKDFLNDVGLVILNYMTVKETMEMLKSVRMYYPGLRVVVVDNGSPEIKLEHLHKIILNYPSVTLLKNRKNLGFAQGNNTGIAALLSEGYKYVVCSNNDVLFSESGILEGLKRASVEYGAGVVGPRIVNLSGEEQNPYQLKRPTKAAARRCYRRACWVPDVAYPALKLVRAIRKKIIPQKKQAVTAFSDPPTFVYGLHCSFIMFCPQFFEFYGGFDGKTFLYGEERIIAEMLYSKDVKSLFVPEIKVIHKEDATSTFVWKSKADRMMFKYYKRSMKYWYINHFKKNSL